MCSAISQINNYIQQTPVDAPFFKIVAVVPVIGQVAQIWKRYILSEELKAIGLDKVDINSHEGMLKYNTSVNKTVEIINLGDQSFKNAKWTDTAFVIAGCAILGLSPPLSATVGLGLVVYGLGDLLTRSLCQLTIDYNLGTQIRDRCPKGGLSKGYARLLLGA